MEQLGKVGEWNDARGYGFLSPLDDTTVRLFFHIRDYQQDGKRPETGEVVKFTACRQTDGRWRAKAVRRAESAERSVPAASHGKRRPSLFPWMILVAAAAMLRWSIHERALPAEAVYVFAGLSAATFTAYALDKHAARTHRWRTHESTLHLLELAGGWPGALIAQRLLHHKSRKPSYQVMFWCMVALNLLGIAGWVIAQPSANDSLAALLRSPV